MAELMTLSIKETKEYARKKAILAANRWKHRRRMAYMAMLSVMVITVCLVFYVPADKLAALDTIISWFYITMGTIIGAYLGFATLDDKWKDSKQKLDAEFKES